MEQVHDGCHAGLLHSITFCAQSQRVRHYMGARASWPWQPPGYGFSLEPWKLLHQALNAVARCLNLKNSFAGKSPPW